MSRFDPPLYTELYSDQHAHLTVSGKQYGAAKVRNFDNSQWWEECSTYELDSRTVVCRTGHYHGWRLKTLNTQKP